nr:UrcA family protein [uncultured Sphingosinicella sp.]
MTGGYLLTIAASFGLFSLGAAVASGSAIEVAAASDVRTAHVGYDDLDLSRPEGLASLNRRIRWAASGLCTSRGTKSLMEPRADRRCVRTAIANASGQIDRAVAGFQVVQGERTIIVRVHR